MKATKRTISSAAASFYDPLGFLLPFIMTLRIFLKGIWEQKFGWDDELPEEIKTQFMKILHNVSCLNHIRIPRFLPNSEDNVIDLIGFADASTHAQAAVLYSRHKANEGYKVILLLARGNVSKSKTAAVMKSKQNTIPKLELSSSPPHKNDAIH